MLDPQDASNLIAVFLQGRDRAQPTGDKAEAREAGDALTVAQLVARTGGRTALRTTWLPGRALVHTCICVYVSACTCAHVCA